MLSPAAPWDSNSRKMSTLFMKKVTCWAFVKCVDGTSVFKIRGFRTATEIFSRERLAEVGGERGQAENAGEARWEYHPDAVPQISPPTPVYGSSYGASRR